MGDELLALVKANEWRFAESRYGYARRLRAAGCEEQVVFVGTTLREIVVQWLRIRGQAKKVE